MIAISEKGHEHFTNSPLNIKKKKQSGPKEEFVVLYPLDLLG
jgi:hypothetical protein